MSACERNPRIIWSVEWRRLKMSELHNRSQISARRSDYVWQYEYYDDEEPVSFEGLKAHRYSIVIGFWVGLAVFVIFMFFVLTLLTKTGAPHQENPDSADKRHRPGSCLVDIDDQKDKSDKAFSRPLLTGRRSYFNFYVNEEGPAQSEKNREGRGGSFKDRRGTRSSDVMEEEIEDAATHHPLNGLMKESRMERERAFLSQFNIPNFVNLEHSSTLGEDDLVYEPSVVLEHHSQAQDAPCDTQ